MKYIVIYNPYACNGNGKAQAEKLTEVLKDGEIVFTDITSVKSYTDFFASVTEDERIILAGGDGTLNRFVNDIGDYEPDRDIYYYAAGSGNDFIRDVCGESGNEPIIINKYIKNLPVVTVKGKTYKVLNGVGYGIDGYCCEVGDNLRRKNNDAINYAGIAIKGVLYAYKPTNAVVTVDGKEYIYKKVWLSPTMNGRFYGGGMNATPDQDRLSVDGKITNMTYQGAGRLRALIIFPSIFKGEHVKHEKVVKIHSGYNIKVKFDRPVALQIDGETILGVTEYEIYSVKNTAPESKKAATV